VPVVNKNLEQQNPPEKSDGLALPEPSFITGGYTPRSKCRRFCSPNGSENSQRKCLKLGEIDSQNANE